MRWFTFGNALLLCVLQACSSQPKLIDYKNRMPATHIIVGTIMDDALVALPIQSHWNKEVILQLRRMRIDVENILRGEGVPGQAVVYYFTFAMSYNGPRVLGKWKTGDRKIVLMRNDSGVFRTSCDTWSSSVRSVNTGSHLVYKNGNGSLQDDLLEIFLTQGRGVSDAEFAANIAKGTDEISFIATNDSRSVAPEAVVRQLHKLALNTVPAIRDAACEALSFYPKPLGNGNSSHDPICPNKPTNTRDPSGGVIE